MDKRSVIRGFLAALAFGAVLAATSIWHLSSDGRGTGGRLFLLPFVITVGVVWLNALMVWIREKHR